MNRDDKHLRIAYWNAQSVSLKINELISFLNSHNIDICLISETWLNRTCLSIQNFRVYQKDRPCPSSHRSHSGGGVAIAIRDTIKHCQLADTNTTSIEAIGIEILFENCPLRFYSVYFANSKNKNSIPLSEQLKHYRNDLKKLTSAKQAFILCGDLNSKHRMWNCARSNRAGQILFDEITVGNLFIDFPPTPTYYPPQANRTTPSTIDIALSNGRKRICNIRAINALSSDHLPVLFEVEGKSNINLVPPRVKRCYAKADWQVFKSKVESGVDLMHLVERLQTVAEIDEAIMGFTRLIISAEDLAVPNEPIKRAAAPLPPDVVKLISRRNYVRKKWQRSRLPVLKSEVNYLSKSIGELLAKHKNEVWNERLARIKPNSKELWKITRVFGKKNSGIPPLKGAADKFLFSDQEKAEEIGRVFNLAHATTLNDRSDAETECKVAASSDMISFLSPEISESLLPTPREIRKIIKRLKCKKSPGIDLISNVLIKHLPSKAIVYLMHIFRAGFRLSYFPKTWKHAKVIPIPKPGKDLSLASSFRPISLLSSLSKIFERLIRDRIDAHSAANKVLPDEQYGFRRSHSGNHLLVRLTRLIKKALTEKESVGMTSYDMERAFDSIWHKALVHKMSILKYPLYLVKLVQSFLSGRSFHVSINGMDSANYVIRAGVPQGSVLSPSLYTIFTSDLNIANCDKALYADDTSFLSSSKSPKKILKNLNLASSQLSSYCSKWKIKLNAGKTQAAYFTRRRARKWLPSDEIIVQGERITWKSSIKTIGLTLDKTLTFRENTDLAVIKSLKFFGILYPLINRRSRINVANKLLIYSAMIRSILLYASPVWGNCAACHLDKLQLIQNKCLKVILDVPRNFPTHALHEISAFPTIREQVKKVNQKFESKLHLSDNPLIRLLR